jgi:DNA modification methylase
MKAEFENYRDPIAKQNVKARKKAKPAVPTANADDYHEFIAAKAVVAPVRGFLVDDAEIHPILKLHQRRIVQWALAGGQRAIFATYGLGKTLQQLEIMRLILAKVGGPVLIVMPLGIRAEFMRDAKMLGLAPKFIRRPEQMEAGDSGLYLTNYEAIRDGRIDPAIFVATSLDEASVLRSFGSLTYQTFLPKFASVRYRFVATATPSPNRLKELIHYAGFLGIMDTGAALTRFFKRDSTKANNLTLYPQHEDAFWHWVHTWGVFLQRPSDIGGDDTGYDLPELKIHYHKVLTDHSHAGTDRSGQALMFKDAAMGLKDASHEKRDSLPKRIEKVMEIVKGMRTGKPDTDADKPAGDGLADQIVIWCDLNDEQDEVEKQLKAAGITVSSMRGSQTIEEREDRIEDWLSRQTSVFLSKPVLYGAGVNLQQCHTMIFAGVNYKAQDMMQSVHRIHRFLQEHPCDVHVVYSEAEQEILKTVMAKQQQHQDMVDQMSGLIKKHGLGAADMADLLKRSMGVQRAEIRGTRYTIANNDCVQEARRMPNDSVDLLVTSIPFSNHYEYTNCLEDMGHTDNNAHFWQQMSFLSAEMIRFMKPGRLACIHVKDRILFGNATGAGVPTVSPFHCETIDHFRKAGFDYLGMITVVTDVVAENNQTYRLGWSENSKDGTKMGVGSPEYVCLFRRPQSDRAKGYADIPVVKSKETYSRSRWQVDAHAFWRSSGNRIPTPDELAKLPPGKLASLFTATSLQQVYDYEAHVMIGEALDARGALPSSFMSLAPGSHHPDVWHDVNRMGTLNASQAKRNQEAHVCPLQWDIIDRLIVRYSNPDELVYDPFNGLGSTVVRAIKLGRRGHGSELSPQYFADSAIYCDAAERAYGVPDLFDVIGATEADQNAA